MCNYISEAERLGALADFLNYYNHERPHSALNGQPPITRTRGSDFRITVEQAPQDDRRPTQLALEFEEPTY